MLLMETEVGNATPLSTFFLAFLKTFELKLQKVLNCIEIKREGTNEYESAHSVMVLSPFSQRSTTFTPAFTSPRTADKASIIKFRTIDGNRLTSRSLEKNSILLTISNFCCTLVLRHNVRKAQVQLLLFFVINFVSHDV